MDQFAQRLREIRGSMTQTEFSALTGISRASISNYENGLRTPDITALRQLHEATGVSVYYLLGLTDVKDDALETVHTETGLSEEALTKIAENPVCAKVINYLVECGSIASIAERAAILHDDERLFQRNPPKEWPQYADVLRKTLFNACKREMTACLVAMLMEGKKDDELFGVPSELLPTNKVVNMIANISMARDVLRNLASRSDEFQSVAATYNDLVHELQDTDEEEDGNDTQTPQP